MPYVLRNRESGEIAAAVMKNAYDLDYFGVRWWMDRDEAEREKGQLTAHLRPTERELWDVIPAEEADIKRMNVRLKNDPANRVLLGADGRLTVMRRDAP
jgi:hypothetical protein